MIKLKVTGYATLDSQVQAETSLTAERIVDKAVGDYDEELEHMKRRLHQDVGYMRQWEQLYHDQLLPTMESINFRKLFSGSHSKS